MAKPSHCPRTDVVLLASASHKELAEAVATSLSLPLHLIDEAIFANGESKPKVPATVRGMHVYLIHAPEFPEPNSGLMSLLLIADALKRASALSISLVLPFIPYMRQDRKDEPRVPISARLLADLIETNRIVKRIITFDLHADQEQGFFSIPVDNLYGSILFVEDVKKTYTDLTNVVVVAPDFGSSVRSRRFARLLGPDVPVAVIEKNRTGINQAEAILMIGPDVTNRDVIIFDDMIDTGGSLAAAGASLFKKGAASVRAYATHGIFSGEALKKLEAAGLSVCVANTLSQTHSLTEAHGDWLTSVDISNLLARAIKESATPGGSVSSLFY